MGGCIARDRRTCAVDDDDDNLLLRETEEMQWLPSGSPVKLPASVPDAANAVLMWGASVFKEPPPTTPKALAARRKRHPGYEYHANVGRQVLPVDGGVEAPPAVVAARRVLEGFAISVLEGALQDIDGVSPTLLGGHQRFDSSSLRLNYYDRSGCICGAHTDSTLVTVVCDTSPGLYMANPQGGDLDWRPVPSRALAAFSGRFLYCLTDGACSAPVPHKVVSEGPRLSVTFFLRPDADFRFAVPRTDPPMFTTYRDIVAQRSFPAPWEGIFDALLNPTSADS